MKMKMTLMATSVLIGMSLVSVSAYSEDSDKDRAHPGAFVKDSVITTKIKTKLAAEKLMSLAKIHVDTDANGMVVLSGTAHTAAQVAKATEIATGTEGVKSVTSTVTVKADD